MLKISWKEVHRRARALYKDHLDGPTICRLYGIPRGGIHAAAALASHGHCELVEDPDDADFFIDDIVDSGRTRELWQEKYPSTPFIALVDKQTEGIEDWVSFCWERMSNSDDGPQENIRRILQYIGEDSKREGLLETPDRVVRSYSELFAGYKQDPADVFKVFEDGACDEMVLLKDVEFNSFCLAGSTFVETPRGRIPISRLKDGEFVYCWDEDNCRMTIARALNPRITGRNKRLWRVYTDKDTVLCTKYHKFLTHNRGWVKAYQLMPGDSIVALNKGAVVYNGITRCQIVWTGLRKQVPEHQFIYKEINGPYSGHVHHLDKQPNNNSPENLTVMKPSDHIRLHRLEDGPTGFALFTDAQRKAMRARQIAGIKASQTEETRRKRSESLKAYWDSLSSEERHQRNHRVLGIERTSWREDVWCMDVPGYENFVANGMIVHNCEHHMIPFLGQAHIAYIPNGKIIGISKLARLLDVFARRLQVQERLTEQVTQALDRYLQPKGSACIIQAKHLCISCRGVGKQHSQMVTSSMTGVFRDNTAARQELLSLIHHG